MTITIVTTATSVYSGLQAFRAFTEALSYTRGSGYYQVDNTTAEVWVQITFPYFIYLSELSFYTRPNGDVYATVSAYADSNKSI